MKTAFVLLFLVSVSAFAAEDEKEFKSLFNGRDLAGWRHRGALKKDNAWEVENGVLKNDLRPGKSGTDLFTEGTYWNFTVRLEFMVPEGSNSGVFLRGRYEIQLTGDYSARKLGTAGNGALWNMKAPSVYASKPSGEWQSMEATITGHKITVLLNGVKIHDGVTCEKPTGGEIDARINEPGPILLQGRLGAVKFRNLRIKELPR